MKPNRARTGLPNKKCTAAEVLERREKLAILRYDENLTEREIAKRLGMSLGRVSEELQVINQEFNKPLDPTVRNRAMAIHDRHHRFVIGQLYRTFDKATTVGERIKILKTLSECLTHQEHFMATVGLLTNVPIQAEVEPQPISDELRERLAELTIEDNLALAERIIQKNREKQDVPGRAIRRDAW